jgi:integrase/recombinase XerC
VKLLLDAFEQWAQNYGPQLAPVSARKYRSVAEDFCRRFGHPAHADTDTMRGWYDTVRGEVKDSAVNVKVAAMRAFFSFLRDKSVICDDPMFGIKMRKVRRGLPSPIEHRDVLRVIELIKSQPIEEETLQDLAIIELLYGSGLRVSEAANLRLANFVSRDAIRVWGKGEKERVTILTDPAYLAVRDLILYRLGGLDGPEYLKDSAFWDMVHSSPAEALFYSKSREVPSLKSPGHFIYGRWVAYTERLGVRKSPHKARHGFATRLRSKGVDLATIQDLLGHEDLETVKIYAALEEEGLRAVKAAHARQLDPV